MEKALRKPRLIGAKYFQASSSAEVVAIEEEEEEEDGSGPRTAVGEHQVRWTAETMEMEEWRRWWAGQVS